MSVCCCCKLVCLGKISDVAWEKMHFTWFSRRDGFSPTRHQILPSPLRGWQDTVSSWEKTPSLLENHVKCISSYSTSLARSQGLTLARCCIQTRGLSRGIKIVMDSHTILLMLVLNMMFLYMLQDNFVDAL